MIAMDVFILGNDLTVHWAIYTEEGNAFPLEDKEISVHMMNGRSRHAVPEFSVSGNVVSWTFKGKSQTVIGDYTLVMEARSGNGRMLTMAYPDAFRLVFPDCGEDDGHEGLLSDRELTLMSKVSIIRLSPILPTIGENGNWWVDGEDTGVSAHGTRIGKVTAEIVMIGEGESPHVDVKESGTDAEKNYHFVFHLMKSQEYESELSVSPDRLEFGPEGGTKSIEINSNDSWTVE